MLLNNVGTSLLNNQRGKRNSLQYRKVFWVNLVLTGSSAIAGAVFIGVFGTHLLRLFGKTFPEGQEILTVLLCAGVIEAVAMASYQVIPIGRKNVVVTTCRRASKRHRFGPFLHIGSYHCTGYAVWGLPTYSAWLLCSIVIFSGCFPHRVNIPNNRRVPATGSNPRPSRRASRIMITPPNTLLAKIIRLPRAAALSEYLTNDQESGGINFTAPSPIGLANCPDRDKAGKEYWDRALRS